MKDLVFIGIEFTLDQRQQPTGSEPRAVSSVRGQGSSKQNGLPWEYSAAQWPGKAECMLVRAQSYRKLGNKDKELGEVGY